MPHLVAPESSLWSGELPEASFVDLSREHLDALIVGTRGEPVGGDLLSLAEEILRKLVIGPGVAILRAFPVEEWGPALSVACFQYLGNHLGDLREQSREGNDIHLVTDKTVLGVSAEAAGGSNSRKRITLHTENARPPHPPHILSLLSLKTAALGGESLLLSGSYVHERLRGAAPKLLERAYGAFNFGRHAEDRRAGAMVDCSPIYWQQAGQTYFRYSRYWLDVAAETVARPHPPAHEELFAAIDDILEDEQAVVRTMLCQGYAVFINNRRVMHGREAFEDSPDVSERRCLTRMWIDMESSQSDRPWHSSGRAYV
jgi:alpha-ketoglutarate-dependent taurine dioxygenase